MFGRRDGDFNPRHRAVAELLPFANSARRTRQPISEIVLATNCGGSDGNSGITANPALGLAKKTPRDHGF